jgi:hypothetical protein
MSSTCCATSQTGPSQLIFAPTAAILTESNQNTCLIKMPDTYGFAGDGVTVLGLVGIISTGIILVLCFTRYFNSPLR